MAIARKPKKPETKEPDVMALINRGLSVAPQDEMESQDEETAIILRIPKATVTRVDRSRKSRKVKTPRNTWLVEAVNEKLERESF